MIYSATLGVSRVKSKVFLKFDDDTFGVNGEVNISGIAWTKRTLTVTMQFINTTLLLNLQKALKCDTKELEKGIRIELY